MAEGERLLRFVAGSKTYTFPNLQNWRDNFTDAVTSMDRLPGVSGSFDAQGMDASPSESGSVQLTLTLYSPTIAGMTAQVDAVRAMIGWGVGKLYMQPADPTQGERYCYARCSRATTASNYEKHTDLMRVVPVNFTVGYPRWMRDGFTGANWGDSTWNGTVWTGGQSFSVGSSNVAGVNAWNGSTWNGTVWGGGAATTISLTNEGTAISLPQIEFYCTDACASGITIELLDDYAQTVLSVSYAGAIAAGQILEIDCRALSVKLDGNDAFSNVFSYVHPALMPLPPGANSLRVTCPSGGGTLQILAPHTYY